jgi:hypothetical protein
LAHAPKCKVLIPEINLLWGKGKHSSSQLFTARHRCRETLRLYNVAAAQGLPVALNEVQQHDWVPELWDFKNQIPLGVAASRIGRFLWNQDRKTAITEIGARELTDKVTCDV